jgi:polyhydroxyalkanoate synthesis regulator phasin
VPVPHIPSILYGNTVSYALNTKLLVVTKYTGAVYSKEEIFPRIYHSMQLVNPTITVGEVNMNTTREFVNETISQIKKKGESMSTKEVIDKIILAALGAWIMTRDEADKVFQELKTSAREDFVKELTDRSLVAKQRIEEAISERAKEVGESLNLASRKHIEDVEKRMDVLSMEMRRLESKLDELGAKREG